MQWVIFAGLWGVISLVGHFDRKRWDNLPKAGNSATLCRSHCKNRLLPWGFKECPRDQERDYCTGELWTGTEWVYSNEPIEKGNGRGGWCATKTTRKGNICVREIKK